MGRRIVILTGNELRHSFFRMHLAQNSEIEVLRSYCEGTEKSIQSVVEAQDNNELRNKHLSERERVEKDFFEKFVDSTPDLSNPIFISKGEINSPDRVTEIEIINPDLIIAYGCSIIKDPLLDKFPHRILNVHLGLSPYYRGSGTNFWPFVNKELEFVGATFMYMDKGVDTGEIIHQIRTEVIRGDSIHHIGNRLIQEMAKVFSEIIIHFDSISKMEQPGIPSDEKYYKKKDFTEESVAIAYENIKNGLVDEYLTNRKEKCFKSPIIINDIFK